MYTGHMNTPTAATAEFATVGTGTSIHYAYRVAGRLTGTYCNRYTRARVVEADAATCSRCAKVAASETSVPNTEK